MTRNIQMDMYESDIDSDELKYLIRKLTKIQGFTFQIKIHYKMICKYHPSKTKELRT